MKKLYTLLILAFFTFFCTSSFAQIVAGSCYLQGTYLEIGVFTDAGFGAPTAPTGYHNNSGTSLGEVYDWGHDGWGVGTPKYMGDYTQPGYPQEGWAIQVAGVTSTAYAPWGIVGSLTGSIVSYVTTGGRKVANWTGGYSGLTIKQETRVDQLASWVTVTTKFDNTTSSTVTGVYYMRTCDPDNTAYWPGGTTTTMNTIVYQNDADHRVMVSAYDNGSYNKINSYLAIGTKDCRAKAFIVNSGLVPYVTNVSDAYDGTGGASGYYYVDSNKSDEAIGMAWKLGNIAAGDSTAISYSYIFDGDYGIDSAHPDPELAINNVPITAYPDTLFGCDFHGVDSLPVDMLYADDKDWTWSKWTWSPSVGLSSTTGVHNYIHLDQVPGYTTYTVTGIDTSAGEMRDCNTRTIIFTVHSCHVAWNNGPCYGDTLQLRMGGDSTGATYYWTGPLGFTSVLHNPFRYPAVWTDTGLYHCYKTIGGIIDTDSTYVIIHPRPIVTATNNGPLCSGMVDTLLLNSTSSIAGSTFAWSGPPSYTSSAQNPTIPGFNGANVGSYRVIVTTSFGCKDTAYTTADTIPRPIAPVITDPSPYCQGKPFVPFTVGHPTGSTVYWYAGPVGGTGSTTASTVSTTVPGYYTVYASDKIGSCESIRSSYTVRIITTPLAPVVTGPLDYCQYMGPVVPLHAFIDPTGTADWYNAATGGTATTTETLPNINVAGVYHYWVSQTDSSCESPRTPVTINIHPKPNPPIITHQQYCQFKTPAAVIATASTAGDALTWYGPGVTPGSSVAPTPNTSIAPAFDTFYVHETSTFIGSPTVACISDSAMDVVPIILKPAPPVPADQKYCQRDGVVAMNYSVDSFAGSTLNWYDDHGGAIAPTPQANTFDNPGSQSWFVSQTFNGCESDSVKISAMIVYKPEFTITSRSAYVCQFDSVTVSYNGPVLPPLAGYHWTLPDGAKTVAGTNLYQPSIVVEFDSSNLNNFVILTASDDSGFCHTDTSLYINVIAQPNLNLYTKADVCLGDTTLLALSQRTPGTYAFTWYVDGVLLGISPDISVISASSNSGGPYLIKWIDSGRHVIEITSATHEGCASAPAFDSVYVHSLPSAQFTYSIPNGKSTLCLEDSVQFSASMKNYNYSYNWAPDHFFNNTNTSTIWGTVQQSQSIVTLTVTDPFGCSASSSLELDPETCCTVVFPNAFAPGSTTSNGENSKFHPVCAGYHRFHMFRIANRWGQTIYESANSADASWDGNYNGVPQDMGVYYYYVKYDCGGNTIEEKGDVTLIR